jgi:hypothetical protein
MSTLRVKDEEAQRTLKKQKNGCSNRTSLLFVGKSAQVVELLLVGGTGENRRSSVSHGEERVRAIGGSRSREDCVLVE